MSLYVNNSVFVLLGLQYIYIYVKLDYNIFIYKITSSVDWYNIFTMYPTTAIITASFLFCKYKKIIFVQITTHETQVKEKIIQMWKKIRYDNINSLIWPLKQTHKADSFTSYQNSIGISQHPFWQHIDRKNVLILDVERGLLSGYNPIE